MDSVPDALTTLAEFLSAAVDAGIQPVVEGTVPGDWVITADGRYRCATVVITAFDGLERREFEAPLGSAQIVESRHSVARCEACGSRRCLVKGRGYKPTWAQCYDCGQVEECV